MKLGDRVKLKPASYKLFPEEFYNKTGIIVREIKPKTNPLRSDKALFSVKWEGETSPAQSLETWVIFENLEFIESMPIEWLITHSDEKIRKLVAP